MQSPFLPAHGEPVEPSVASMGILRQAQDEQKPIGDVTLQWDSGRILPEANLTQRESTPQKTWKKRNRGQVRPRWYQGHRPRPRIKKQFSRKAGICARNSQEVNWPEIDWPSSSPMPSQRTDCAMDWSTAGPARRTPQGSRVGAHTLCHSSIAPPQARRGDAFQSPRHRESIHRIQAIPNLLKEATGK